MSRVALIGENSIGYINALIDIWNNGDCAVLIDWRIPYQTVLEMMAEAGVCKCYIEQNLFAKMEKNIADLIEYIPYEKLNNSAELLPNCVYEKFHENYSRDEAVIIYSSGTTGKSKGIILSHFAISTNADAIIDYMTPTPEDCIYIAKTLSHSSTLTGELLIALKMRMKLVIASIIVPPRYTLKNIQKFRITVICLNPTLLSMCSDEYDKSRYDISSLKTIYVSGSILNDKIYKKAHEVFNGIPIYNVYGLSEAGPRVSAQRLDCCLSNSVGRAISGVSFIIVDEYGEESRIGERGVVHVYTPSLYSGYIKGEEKYRSLYHDWLNTGDVGYIDNEGELHIVDRVDDVITIHSHKVYPCDIEEIVLSHPAVTDCVVACSGKEMLICEYTANSETDISNELSQICRKILSINEVPSIFQQVKNIDRTLNGKKIRKKK